MKNKRGSHVGIVISFTFFIAFIIFAYSIFAPSLITKSQMQDSIKVLEDAFKERIKEDVFIIRTYDSDSTCISISKPSNSFSNENIIARNSSSKINSGIYGDNIIIDGQKGFVKVYFSSDSFNFENHTSFSSCDQENTQSLTLENKYLENKILYWVNQSVSNYSDFHSELGANFEFEVLFDYKNGTIIGDRGKNVKTDVFAQTLTIEYLSYEAQDKVADLIFSVW